MILAPLLFAVNPWANVALHRMKQKSDRKNNAYLLEIVGKSDPSPINAFDKLTKSESTEEDCMTSTRTLALIKALPGQKQQGTAQLGQKSCQGFTPNPVL